MVQNTNDPKYKCNKMQMHQNTNVKNTTGQNTNCQTQMKQNANGAEYKCYEIQMQQNANTPK